MGSPTFPEWEQAHRNARPEDGPQGQLVSLLVQLIHHSEKYKQAIRKQALERLIDSMPAANASRLNQRLNDPKDALQIFRILSTIRITGAHHE